jgi:hypothetical protein
LGALLLLQDSKDEVGGQQAEQDILESAAIH